MHDLARSPTLARPPAVSPAGPSPADIWTAERVRDLVTHRLGGGSLLVVSNREPYVHEHHGDEIRWMRPASGLVTAVEPIMRAIGGTWIAHGSGSADRKVVDPDGRIMVPPDDPRYALRRVWLTEDEERGYYYGFANETLWPLCHVVYVRPTFRSRDWAHYQAVNAHFCRAVAEEAPRKATVWVHDYHLALLPAMLKAARPDLTVAHFWHIPWPSSEVFRICPWRKEILEGLLANDVLGFHIRYHCDNFLEAVSRELEVNIDRENSAVTYGGHTTLVRPFPISVDAADIEAGAQSEAVAREMVRLREQYGLVGDKIVVGLDRFDYTKGIPERLMAVDRLLTVSPEWLGRLVFVQAGVPSRSRIPAYRSVWRRIERLVRRINQRHGRNGWAPIVLLPEHLSRTAILALYRIADCLMVSSLHDGMNLVAKEYVAARADGDGTLVLSQFTGAAREFPEAFLVNPYNLDGTAERLGAALTMPEPQRRGRMTRLRERVLEWNIYRWAGEMLGTVLRLPDPEVIS
jgi:trehalose 6-phosphate synthase